MRKIVIIVATLLAACSSFGQKLSKDGYNLIDNTWVIQEDIQSCEQKLAKDVKRYGFKLPQDYYDALILVGSQLTYENLRNTSLYNRAFKLRSNESGCLKRADLRFMAVGVLDMGDYLFTANSIHKHMTRNIAATGSEWVEISKQPTTTKNAQTQKKTHPKKTSTPTTTKKTEYVMSGKNRVWRISEDGKKMIKKFEGYRLTAYWDVNAYSIGYGHHSYKLKKGDKITSEQADKYFDEDIKKFEEYAYEMLALNLPYEFNFSQGFVDGFISAMYNCGPTNLSKSRFYNALRKCRVKDGKMNRKDYIHVTNLLKYTCAPTKQHKERRQKESACMQACL